MDNNDEGRNKEKIARHIDNIKEGTAGLIKYGEGARIFEQPVRYMDIGGGKVGILFPEVYFMFVSELYRDHDDLIRGMTLAQVRLNDGSALDYLNLMLGTDVHMSTPMEIGYAQLLDALRMRVKTKITQKKIEETAEAFKDHQMFKGKIDGPLFPDEPTQ